MGADKGDACPAARTGLHPLVTPVVNFVTPVVNFVTPVVNCTLLRVSTSHEANRRSTNGKTYVTPRDESCPCNKRTKKGLFGG